MSSSRLPPAAFMDSAADATVPLLPGRLRRSIAGRLRIKTSVWSELGGAVGDLSTYIPIVLALSLVNHLDISTTLIFTALYNTLTGLLFGIPMPVQPTKSIAAVAIADICTASTLLLLGAIGLMSFFYRYLPLPVVRGVQLSQCLAFAFSAIKYIRFDQDFAAGKSGPPRPWLGLDGLVLALFTLLFVILVTDAANDADADSTIAESATQSIAAAAAANFSPRSRPP